MLQVRLKIAVCLLVLAFASPVFAEPNFGAAPLGLEEEIKKPKKPLAIGFSGYAKQLKNVCELLEKDGRRQIFARHLDYALQEETQCAACKALLKSFISACKLKQKKDRKKKVDEAKQEIEETQVSEEETDVAADEAESEDEEGENAQDENTKLQVEPSLYKPQREPSVVLLDSLSHLGIALVADTKRSEFARITFEKLASLLRSPEDLSAGEVEYLDILTEYMLAPYSSAAPDVAPISAAPIDDLF